MGHTSFNTWRRFVVYTPHVRSLYAASADSLTLVNAIIRCTMPIQDQRAECKYLFPKCRSLEWHGTSGLTLTNDVLAPSWLNPCVLYRVYGRWRIQQPPSGTSEPAGTLASPRHWQWGRRPFSGKSFRVVCFIADKIRVDSDAYPSSGGLIIYGIYYQGALKFSKLRELIVSRPVYHHLNMKYRNGHVSHDPLIAGGFGALKRIYIGPLASQFLVVNIFRQFSLTVLTDIRYCFIRKHFRVNLSLATVDWSCICPNSESLDRGTSDVLYRAKIWWSSVETLLTCFFFFLV